MFQMSNGPGSPLLLRAFYEVLSEMVGTYTGRFQEMVALAPPMFKLFINLVEDPMVPEKCKPIINATLAYFVAPLDAVPDLDYGPVGYLDDLFICTWSLKKLEDLAGCPVLENNWEGERELSIVIDEMYERSKGLLGEVEADIIDYFEAWIQRCSEGPESNGGDDIINNLLKSI